MNWWQSLTWTDVVMGGCWLFIFLCAVVPPFTRPKRRKTNRYVGHKSDPNVRVPRETLWTRTNRYHGEPK